MIIKKPLQYATIIDKQGDYGVFDTMDDAIRLASVAQKEYSNYSISKKEEIINSLKKEFKKHLEELSTMTCNENGIESYDNNLFNNTIALNKTFNIEDNNCGVIGAIAPSSNTIQTIIGTSLAMLSSGNAVVFSSNKNSKHVYLYAVKLINKAIENVNGPRNLIVTVKEPSTDNTNLMIQHEEIAIISVSGDSNIEETAVSFGKKTIGIGA